VFKVTEVRRIKLKSISRFTSF